MHDQLTAVEPSVGEMKRRSPPGPYRTTHDATGR